MSRGRFIAFEGGEGMGKSTQARLLAEHLRQRGLTVEQTREPGGTPGAEAIRELLLAPPGEGWTLEAEALLFAAARADHVARKIRPALDRGTWVICDRFLDSSRAYQGVAGGLGDDAVRALHEFGSAGLLPDLTIVIDVPTADVADRLAARDGATSDAIGGRTADYHAAVNAAFLDFARAEPDQFAVVDGSGSVEEVHQRVLETVGYRLAGTG
ncbi:MULTISPECIES: dTMP kinase [unclassified Erythrobacter]|uniref:dTMP kinase n=1 Tax=unclassified Erythrobacter TaxID=2633097 RepID=UPI00076D45DF|nr:MULTISPECIES: dTMP kinase [unclassified Erythrobacter]KWV96027.1 thymidylate kinase [Erythrobacter sp. AP23]MBO6768578.1 dTMP kinase [Erythrobacter sp.]